MKCVQLTIYSSTEVECAGFCSIALRPTLIRFSRLRRCRIHGHPSELLVTHSVRSGKDLPRSSQMLRLDVDSLEDGAVGNW